MQIHTYIHAYIHNALQVYSTMMAGYGTSGKFFEAQELIKEMQKRRIRPNEYTFTSLTEAFINAGVYTCVCVCGVYMCICVCIKTKN